MSFLNGLRGVFGDTSPDLKAWIFPETVNDLGTLFEPDSGLHLIYKHSSTCGTCFFAKRNVEASMAVYTGECSYYFIEVHSNRELSDFVENQTEIRHESPQAILLKDGQVIWHAAHGSITSKKIEEEFQKTGIIS